MDTSYLQDKNFYKIWTCCEKIQVSTYVYVNVYQLKYIQYQVWLH